MLQAEQEATSTCIFWVRLYQCIHSRGNIAATRTLVKHPVFVDVFGIPGETYGVRKSG